MGDRGIVIEYVRACTAGSLGMSDCGPVWLMGIIVALLLVAIATLVALRLRAGARPHERGRVTAPPIARAGQLAR